MRTPLFFQMRLKSLLGPDFFGSEKVFLVSWLSVDVEETLSISHSPKSVDAACVQKITLLVWVVGCIAWLLTVDRAKGPLTLTTGTKDEIARGGPKVSWSSVVRKQTARKGPTLHPRCTVFDFRPGGQIARVFRRTSPWSGLLSPFHVVGAAWVRFRGMPGRLPRSRSLWEIGGVGTIGRGLWWFTAGGVAHSGGVVVVCHCWSGL